IRGNGYDPQRHYEENATLRRVIDAIGKGEFSPDDPTRFKPIVESLLRHDTYLLLADFAAYLEAQARVDALFGQPTEWARRAALNFAGMCPLSTVDTTREYPRQTWRV